MDSLPVWAIWSTPAGAFVLAPVLSFSVAVAVAAVTIIGLLMEAGVHLVVVPVDYSENSRVLLEELRTHAAESGEQS